MKFSFKILILLYPLVINAHGNRGGHKREIVDFKKENLKTINRNYVEVIKPIFLKKCFDCHSNNTKYPWYYSIPGVKLLIDQDIKKGLEHIDYSDNFPFKSHGEGPEDDLKATLKAVIEDSMPPIRYRLLHWDSKITNEEKKIIKKWVDDSLRKLEQSKD
ncbi:MAG: hypothetical protein E2O68_08075 [Deltaproteobacteria bacterium]|nr:MAG: hypothetical protein E2O68_08075 [Deltaproteobacteria bacterium]